MVSLCVIRFHTNVYGYQYYTFFISNAVRERKKKYLYPKRKRKRDIFYRGIQIHYFRTYTTKSILC